MSVCLPTVSNIAPVTADSSNWTTSDHNGVLLKTTEPEACPKPDVAPSSLISVEDAEFRAYDNVARFLPAGSDDESYWWNLIGRQVASMMYKADYSFERQVELLVFHRFYIIPALGPRPTSHVPWYRSRVAPGAGDGTPIAYSWKWSTGIGKPTIRHYMEPQGALTSTRADPRNETAPKQLLLQLASKIPGIKLDAFWKYAEHLRAFSPDESTRQRHNVSAILLGIEMPAESDRVDVMAGFLVKMPEQVPELLPTIIPAAFRDVLDGDISLEALNTAREFIDNSPYLSVNGTMAVDCIDANKSRFKFYVMNKGTSFDHIENVMSLGGRRPLSRTALNDLRELWFGLKGLPMDYPTSLEVPAVDVGESTNGTASSGNVSGLSFYFDIHPQRPLPDVKMQVDLGKHAKNDWEPATVVTDFLSRRGQAHYAQAYLDMLQSMVPIEELQSCRGVLAYFSFAVKGDQVEVKSYFNAQAYRRYHQNRRGTNHRSPKSQRRSLFE
ncbi:tryptophan dimethylallyltransferase-domain-containing protein [Xylariales sp. PMI_506]|nr:tryptophan dimethylallyltransferase-domain-containing protein [Xylariales sp. PMI_506]